MATEFRRYVKIKPADHAEIAAIRLEEELWKLFPGGDSFHEWTRGGKGKWSLKDSSGSVTRDRSVRTVFHEFREQHLQPHLLQGDRHGVAGAFGESTFTVYIYFGIEDGTLRLRIDGRDQITVDGVKAICERIKAVLETPTTEDISLVPFVKVSWWSRLLKEHLPFLVGGIIVAVVAGVILSWIGLGS